MALTWWFSKGRARVRVSRRRAIPEESPIERRTATCRHVGHPKLSLNLWEPLAAPRPARHQPRPARNPPATGPEARPQMTRDATWYVATAHTQASTSWNTTEKSVHLRLSLSWRMVAIEAMHGT